MSTMEGFDRLTTLRLIMRRFRDDDLTTFLVYRNDGELGRYQGWKAGFSEEEARGFIEEMKRAEPLGDGMQIAVELAATGELVGDLYVGPYGDDARQRMLGYTLVRRHQGYGYATEAARALLNYLFGSLAVHRVVATVDTRNGPSVALLERLGMRREAHHIQAYWDHGTWADEYVYAILSDEWLGRGAGDDAQA